MPLSDYLPIAIAAAATVAIWFYLILALRDLRQGSTTKPDEHEEHF